jgi:hypothetical protein
MSNHYDQKDYSVIALVSVDSNNHKDNQLKKAIIITDPSRKNILKEYSNIQLHATLIATLLEGLVPLRKVFICSDINPVEKVIGGICEFYPELTLGNLASLNDLRDYMGNKNYKSEADAFAADVNRSFPKRNNIHRKKDYFEDGSVIIISKGNEHEMELKEKMRRFIESNR